ncbi:MAG: carbohydrate-binding family 9-like protein [Bacteroidota bacterium]
MTRYLWYLCLLFPCSQGLTQEVYRVNKINSPIELTGKGDDPKWEQAESLTDFVYPWNADMAPSTEFRAVWDQTAIYFLYIAQDSEIIIKEGSENKEMDVVHSDRVEIFFKADDEMNPYYSLEMDAVGRLFDSEGRMYRQIDAEWDWPEGHITLASWKNKKEYRLEGTITLESLRKLGLYKDDHKLKAGLYRGEYTSQPNRKPKVQWISWVRPNSDKPDFHIPSSFGILRLVQE